MNYWDQTDQALDKACLVSTTIMIYEFFKIKNF